MSVLRLEETAEPENRHRMIRGSNGNQTNGEPRFMLILMLQPESSMSSDHQDHHRQNGILPLESRHTSEFFNILDRL
jgi:hypothetical protein